MLDCIQTNPVDQENRDINKANVSLRLSGPEAVRYWRVMDAAKERNPYIRLTDVIREIVGLNEPNVLSTEEILFFRTGNRDKETSAKFHNAEQVEFPQKKLKVSDDRRDTSEVSKPRKRGGKR